MPANAPWEYDKPVQQAGAAPWEQDAPVQQAAPAPAPEPDASQFAPIPAPEQPAPENSVGRDLQIGAQAVGRGAADVLGFPVDFTTMGFNSILSGADYVADKFGGSVDTRIEKPFLGSDYIADLASQGFELLGGDTIERDELAPKDRLASDAIRFGTGALAGGAGAVKTAATKTAQELPVVGRTIEEVGKRYLGASPGKAVAGDVAAGGGAGTGNFAYEEYVPDAVKEHPVAGPIAHVGSVLAGGVGGGTAAAGVQGAAGAAGRTIQKTAGRHVDREVPRDEVTGDRFNKVDVDAAARLAQEEASNPQLAARNIEETSADLRGYTNSDNALPPTGSQSRDVGLVAMENQARVQNGVPFTEQAQRTNTAARDQVDNLAPQDADPRAFTERAAEVAETRTQTAQKGVDKAQGEIEGVQRAREGEGAVVAQNAGGKPAASAAIDDTVVEGTLRPMQEQNARLYNEVDPGRIALVPTDNLLNTAREVRDTLGDLNTPSKIIPESLLQRIERTAGEEGSPEVPGTPATTRTEQSSVLGPDGQPLTKEIEVPEVPGQPAIPDAPSQTSVGDITAVMPELATTIERARRAGNYTLVDNLRALRAEMKATVEEAARGGDEAAQRFVAADKNYAETIGPTFNRGPGDEGAKFRKDFNLDRQNRTTTPPSQTAGRFLRPGQAERAESLSRIIEKSNDPETGRAAVRDYLMSDLAESGVLDKSGVLRPDALRKWRDQKWGDVLDEAPEFRGEVDNLLARAQKGEKLAGEFATELKQAERGMDAAKKNNASLELAIGKSPTKAARDIFGSKDPEKAVDDILRDIGGNAAAKDGLKAAIRDHLIEDKTTSAIHNTTDGANPVSFDRLDKLFKRHEKILAKVYSPEEMNALQGAHKLLKPGKQRELQATSGSPTAERTGPDLWRWTEIGLKAKYGILKGGGIMRTLRLWADTLPSNKEAVGQLHRQMWFDPELAAHLLRKPLKDIDTPAWNQRLQNLLAVGAGARDVADEE